MSSRSAATALLIIACLLAVRDRGSRGWMSKERSDVVENGSSIWGLARAVSSTWTSWDLQLRRSCERYF